MCQSWNTFNVIYRVAYFAPLNFWFCKSYYRIPMNGSGVVIEVCYIVFRTHCLYSKNRIKSIELVRRSGFRQGYASCTSVVIEYQCAVPGQYLKYVMQLSEPMFRIREIVSKLALVLLLNPTPLEYRSREVNSRDTNKRFQADSIF